MYLVNNAEASTSHFGSNKVDFDRYLDHALVILPLIRPDIYELNFDGLNLQIRRTLAKAVSKGAVATSTVGVAGRQGSSTQ